MVKYRTFILLLCVCLCACQYDKMLWHLKELNIRDLQKYSQGKDQVIAIIDSGISNRLLNWYEERIIGTYNVIDESENVKDRHGHGSEMAVLVLDKQISIAPQSKIIVIKVINDEGSTNNALLLRGLKKAEEYGADIINLSLGGYKKDEEVIQMIHQLIKKNITVVASAGDYGDKDLLFPANVKGVISVGAFDDDHKLWQRCNIDNNLLCAFPGVDIMIPNNILDGDLDNDILGESHEGWIKKTGTSEATILMSSYIALIKEYYRGIDNESIISKLEELKLLSLKKINYLSVFE